MEGPASIGAAIVLGVRVFTGGWGDRMGTGEASDPIARMGDGGRLEGPATALDRVGDRCGVGSTAGGTCSAAGLGGFSSGGQMKSRAEGFSLGSCEGCGYVSCARLALGGSVCFRIGNLC